MIVNPLREIRNKGTIRNSEFETHFGFWSVVIRNCLASWTSRFRFSSSLYYLQKFLHANRSLEYFQDAILFHRHDTLPPRFGLNF